MAAPKSVWGIDIGQCALKALKLRNVNGEVRVEAFDIIEHPKILSQAEGDKDQLIRNALEQFLARNSLDGCEVAVSVPGQNSFSRFVKLPPVETKKIPDIVRFEAEQQIPFPMEDVVWRWQTFEDPDSPDVEVGIFAMKRLDVAENLRHFGEVELEVNAVQMAPLSLYNFMTFDEQLASEGATLLVDVGADKTDLVVSDGARIWTRTIQIGGNDFTEALVKAFKLSFAKAEKLKRTAASSKYARQVFQTMRPVFSDLVQEIQRSIGFYTSLHRESRFKKVLGLGNGFRLPGLQKFLEQNLNVPVSRIDSFNRVTHSDAVNAPTFQENVLSFAVAYGLGVQGLGLADINTNLLPREVASQRMWSAKKPWFAAAAAMVVIALALMLYRSYADLSTLEDTRDEYRQAEQVAERLDELKSTSRRLEAQVGQGENEIKDRLKLFAYRNFWPSVQKLVSRSVASTASHQNDYITALTSIDPNTRQQALERLENMPRQSRQLLFVESFKTRYVSDVSTIKQEDLLPVIAQELGMQITGDTPSRRGQDEDGLNEAQAVQGKRGFLVWMICRTTVPESQIRSQIITPMRRFGRQYAAERLGAISVVADDGEYEAGVVATPGEAGGVRTPDYAPPRDSRDLEEAERGRGGGYREGPRRSPTDEPTGQQAGVSLPDPVFKGESMASDTRVGMIWLVAIEDDGLGLDRDDQGGGGR
ncbi:MAG: type IV pilus assembly protein PilM [Phycisphaerae bacterium]